MEYLDLLQSLSSNDPFLQITGITRITAAIKSQPSPIFVNTVAINMAVEFSKSSNYVRHFITQFFQQCSTEMCMIKSKIDIFRHLTSILDVNDPVAQCNMLKILMYLAPLLADFLEIHHKILLALESPHRKVRETASEILPKVISYAPSIARHVFEKPISKFSVKKLISVLPDDEETMKKAYAYIVSTFQKSEMMEYLCYLAIRSPRLIKHVTEILKKYNETGYLKELSKFYRKDMIFGSDNTVNLPARNQHVEIEIKLKSEKLNEKDYKEIFKNWDKACQYEWIADRLEIMVANNSKEIHMCLKLAKLVKIPQIYLENILSKHIMDSQILLQLTYILIRSNSLDSISHITHKLDNYQLYLLACEFMTFGCHSKSLEIFVKLKTEFKGSNEKSYEWLCTLTIISEFESRKDKKVDGFAALSHLGCLDLGHKIYFQSEFLLCRLLLVHYLKLLQNPSMETSALTVEFVKLRSRFHKLLYLFAKTSQSTSQCLKKWRDITGMVYLMLNSPKNHQSRLKRFYPNSCSIFDNTSADPFEISSCVLNLPMNFPKQFFKFKNPISILLQISQEMVIKVNRGKEFLFETSAKVTELSHKPPLLEFNIVGMQQDTQPEFNVSYKKKSTAAGVCNINVPLVLAYTGIYTVKIHATILDAKSRQIGKGEYGEIIIECI